MNAKLQGVPVGAAEVAGAAGAAVFSASALRAVPIAGAAGAAPTLPNAAAPALRLLRHEADVRRLKTDEELLFHLVNDVRALLPYGSALVLRRRRGSGQLRAGPIADLPDVDHDAPLLRALVERVGRFERSDGLAAPAAFDLLDAGRPGHPDPAAAAGVPAADAALLADYPFRHLLWLPLKNRPHDDGAAVDAGVVYARAEPFTTGERTLLARLAETYAHAWAALPVRRRFSSGLPVGRRTLAAVAVVLTGLALLPVRLSVMAPVEVVAADPFVVTAPIAGVVKAILVAPDGPVLAGQPLLQFEDIQPRNEMVLAQQRLAVAQARDTRTGAAAFRDATAAHDMAAARAELNLAKVSYDYAVEVLARTRVKTPTAGVAIYTDRRDWEGRSVMVGEEILQVADPARVALRVDLSTANSIDLSAGAEASIYLDHAPLGGLKAQVRSVSYTPRSQPGGGATSYTVIADFDDDAGATAPADPPRIGARGTARLYGARVPLGFQLLRRPIAAARQFLGL